MLLQDLRYALRQLRRAPGFALTVALTKQDGLRCWRSPWLPQACLLR